MLTRLLDTLLRPGNSLVIRVLDAQRLMVDDILTIPHDPALRHRPPDSTGNPHAPGPEERTDTPRGPRLHP